MIAESEITDCLEHKVKSKIENIFVNKKVLEEYSIKINNIHPYFCEHYKEKVQVNRNGYEYILFRIDAYFTEYLLAVEFNETKHLDRDLFFEDKREKALEKKLVLNLLGLTRVKKAMIQTMKLVEYKHLSINLKTDN